MRLDAPAIPRLAAELTSFPLEKRLRDIAVIRGLENTFTRKLLSHDGSAIRISSDVFERLPESRIHRVSTTHSIMRPHTCCEQAIALRILVRLRLRLGIWRRSGSPFVCPRLNRVARFR
jgi:hypothetical protein